MEWTEELPDLLKDVFEDNSQNLDSSKKEKFVQLLVNFQNIFEDDDVAAKCNLVEHRIELTRRGSEIRITDSAETLA